MRKYKIKIFQIIIFFMFVWLIPTQVARPAVLLYLIYGQVLDAISGEPIDEAVIVTNSGGAAMSVNGEYELFNKPVDTIIFQAKAEGYEDYLAGYVIPSDIELIIRKDIEMVPLASTTTSIPDTTGFISGTIIDQQTSEPIPEALITIKNDFTEKGFSPSDQEGSFSLESVTGTKILKVYAQGYEPFIDEIIVEEDQVVTENVFLFSTYIPVLVVGVVKNLLTLDPIDGASITTTNGGDIISIDGEYELFQNLGEWTFNVTADGYIPEIRQVKLEEYVSFHTENFLLLPIDISTTTTILQDCLSDAVCDDGLFCTGIETCIDQVCQPGTNPCPEGLACDEGNDTCSYPYISITPKFMLQSQWMPLPVFVSIKGTNTHFDGTSEVTFSPASIIPLPFVWDKGMITCIGLMMPSFLTEPLNGTIEINVTTGIENVSATIEVKPMLSMFNQGKQDIREMDP